MSTKTYNLKQIIDERGLDILEIRALAQFANIPFKESETVPEAIALCIAVYAILKACKFQAPQLYTIFKESYESIVAYLEAKLGDYLDPYAIMLMENRYLTMPTWDHVFDIFELKSIPLQELGFSHPVFTYTIDLFGVLSRDLNK